MEEYFITPEGKLTGTLSDGCEITTVTETFAGVLYLVTDWV